MEHHVTFKTIVLNNILTLEMIVLPSHNKTKRKLKYKLYIITQWNRHVHIRRISSDVLKENLPNVYSDKSWGTEMFDLLILIKCHYQLNYAKALLIFLCFYIIAQ